MITDFSIDSVEDLRVFFRAYPKETCFVTTEIRKAWLINHCSLIVRGNISRLVFKDTGGGVWSVDLTS